MKTPLLASIVVMAFAWAPASVSAADSPARVGKNHRIDSPDQLPQGLAKSDWQSIREAYEAGRHAFQPVEGGWQARNPGQQWTTRFDHRGFLATPREGGWTWGLELKSYGFGSDQHPIQGTPAVKADGQRLSYRWDDMVEEWFVNDRRGLEHGFTVARRPAEAGKATPTHGALSFLLDTRGNLHPRITAGGLGVIYHDANGAVVLNYTGLKVTDADGRTLASRFEAADGNAVRLLVEEKDARYPITIDPIAQQAYLKASNTGGGDWFGFSVAISGDTVVVGARDEDSSTTGVNSTPNEGSSGSGAVYVFVRNGTAWTQQAYLKASNTGAGDRFGYAVAVSGDTLVVGAYPEDSGTTGVNSTPNEAATDSGAAYVFVRSGTTWTQQAYLKAHNTGAGDFFGVSVAISDDTIIVGASSEDSGTTGVNSTPDESASGAGAAYVFTRSGTNWSQQAYLKASNSGAGDGFGCSVTVSGGIAVIGANGEDSSTTGVNSNPNELAADSGAAYVFTRSGTIWTQQAYLKASNTGTTDGFGYPVAASAETVVVGAYQEDSGTTGVNSTPNESAADSGAAYVFTRSGTTWSQQAYLKAGNTGAGDCFGLAAGISGDSVVIGAYLEDSSTTGVNGTSNEGSNASGAAYVFTRNGTTWSQQAYLKPSNTGTQDQFGLAVAISGDTAVVGAWEEDSSTTGVNSTPNDSATNSGAAYVFTGLGNAPPAFSWRNFAGLPGTSGSADGGGSSARFNYPCGALLDANGNLYVTDQENHVIRKISPAGEVVTFAGTSGVSGSTDGARNLARFSNPTGIAADSMGNFFVGDYGNHTIRRVTPAGVVTTFAGSAGLSGSNDGTGNSARFKNPRGIAIDASDNLIVADWGNNTVRKISPGGVVTTLAGMAGVAGFSDGVGTSARFSANSGVAVDSGGNAYVTDSDYHLIRKVTPNGTVTTLAGLPGAPGSSDGTGSAARFRYPTGIAATPSGDLIVADYNNHTIRRISMEAQVTTIGGFAGSSGFVDGIGSNARFNRPYSMAVDGSGIIFACDLYNHRISKGVPAALLNGCVAWWRGEDNFQDSVGSNHGNGLNGATFGAGMVGQAWSFDGVNDYVEVPSSASLNLVTGQGWTLEGWIRPANLSNMKIAHMGLDASGGTIPYWQFWIRGDDTAGALAFEMCPGTGSGQYDYLQSTALVTAGVWQHVAVVVDSMGGSVSGIHFYINGLDAGHGNSWDSATSGNVSTAAPLCIGSLRGLSAFFNGRIDELSIYNRGLSPSEVAAVYAAGSAGKLGGVSPTITTESPLPAGMAGVSYRHDLTATGGVPPYAWSIASGALPDGLVLASGGSITGAPSASGTSNFTVRVTGNDGGTTTRDFSLTIAPAMVPPVIVTASPLPNGKVGVPYSLGLSAADGVPPYSWVVTAGGLPDGLELSGEGLLHGTPTIAGSASFTVRVTGEDGGSATKELSLTVEPGLPAGAGLSSLSLFNASLSPAFNRSVTAYTASIPIDFTRIEAIAENPASLVEWRIGSGEFASEIPFQLPLVMGANVMEIRVTNPEADVTAYTLALNRVPGTISDRFHASVPDSWGQPWDFVEVATALAVQADHKVVVGGSFYDSAGGSSVKLARLNANGTLDAAFEPGLAGEESLLIRALAVQGDGKILVAGNFSSIGGTAASHLARLNPDGTLDSGFTPALSDIPGHIQIQADGKIVVASWGRPARLNPDGSADAGFNPPMMGGQVNGLTLQSDGKILVLFDRSGVVRLQANGDLDTGFTTGSLDFPDSYFTSMAVLPDGRIWVAGLVSEDDFSGIARLNADGTPDPSYFIDIDEGGMGVISLLVQADGGVVVGGEFFQIGGQTRQCLARLLPDGSVDGSFIPGVEGGGSSTHVLCLASLSDGRIMVGGKFSKLGGKDRSAVGRLMADGQGATITITTPGRLPGGTVGELYHTELAASGGTAPYHWRIAGGMLDEGLALGDDGVISGVPTGSLAGNTITIEASDHKGWAVTKDFVLVTGELFLSYDTELPWGIVGKTYNLQVNILGGTAPYTYSMVDGDLPDDLSLSPDGRITGTPVATGTSQFTVRVVDSDGIWKEKTLNLAIYAATDLRTLVAEGGLTPEFSPAVTNYQAEPAGDYLNLYAWQADDDASLQVRINGSPYQPWIPDQWLGTDFALVPGLNTIEILVSAAGGQTKTYTITAIRAFPLISVQFEGSPLTDGSGDPVGFGMATYGKPSTKSFTVTNAGTSPLRLETIHLSGSHAADFAVGVPPTQVLAPGDSTTLTVTFRPSGGGVRTASIHIGSNSLGDLESFDILVSGSALSYGSDSDGDGMNDAAEFEMNALGFKWQDKQSDLVATYYSGANGAGLYTAAQLQALQIDTPMLVKDPQSGGFTLTLRIAKSTDLAGFSPFPVTAPQVSVNGNGELEVRFVTQDDAAFFRIEAK